MDNDKGLAATGSALRQTQSDSALRNSLIAQVRPAPYLPPTLTECTDTSLRIDATRCTRAALHAQMKVAIFDRLIGPFEAARQSDYVAANNGWLPLVLRDTKGSLAIAVRDDTPIDSNVVRFFYGGLSKKMQQESRQCNSFVVSKWQCMLPTERWEKFLSKVC
jgi:hypothetical protein